MKVVKFSAALFIGLFMMLAVTSQVATAQSSAAPASQGGTVPRPSSQLTYAWVVTNNVQVYAAPGDTTPVRDLGAGFLYVSLPDARPIVVGDQTWYQINKGEYINAADIRIIRPSAFQGITFTATPDKPFGWMVYSVKPSAKAGEAAAADGQDASIGTTPITVIEEAKVGDLTWYRIGENQWVDQKKVALIFPAARPEGVGPTDKWIDINKFEQTLAAYEGDQAGVRHAGLIGSAAVGHRFGPVPRLHEGAPGQDERPRRQARLLLPGRRAVRDVLQ